ncbi:hypothetical protein [Novosphingobium sp. KACC 22771]|uniref:hypothetical protein n=1 Tax=Novosphingobium sp. KACC 22771 TaxID=3025670 RepID=UPI00236709EB|nr:hypothetical protein [Novosphingobium sp. KACC 22771]WDF73676.1 hypothetical protein PQ467_06445 [Novosphingobium sp. KACC 22771]
MAKLSGAFAVLSVLAVFATVQSGGSVMALPRHLSSSSMPVQAFLSPASAQDMADMRRYYPIEKYRSFPRSIRPLLQRADSEQGACRGLADGQKYNGLSGPRRCNLSHRAFVLLEERGWCWGGSDIEAEKHWMRCREIPRYVIGTLRAEGDPFSAADIEKTERGAR